VLETKTVFVKDIYLFLENKAIAHVLTAVKACVFECRAAGRKPLLHAKSSAAGQWDQEFPRTTQRRCFVPSGNRNKLSTAFHYIPIPPFFSVSLVSQSSNG
jgi:hypothetical protein